MLQKTKNAISVYDEKQKRKLVELGTSNKSYKDILVYLESEIEKSTQMVGFHYDIPCFYKDGIYQLHKAIEKIYGASSLKVNESTPSGEDDRIEILTIPISQDEIVKVPIGKISLPELGDDAYIDIAYNKSKGYILFSGNCEFRFSSIMDEIYKETVRLINTESIYASQAFSIDTNDEVEYLNLDNIDKEVLIMSEKLKRDLKPLTARILEPKKCIEKNIPLKYGVLLSGKYGTGKTLVAFKLAKDAIKNNWTFIYLKNPHMLEKVLKLCKTIDNSGNGVIVFTEDIDQSTRGERNSVLQGILNTLDGGDTKNMNVISLFTTNHIELIEPTFLRGKRIGSIIEFGHLDSNTAKEFLEHFFNEPEYTLEKEGLEDLCNYIEEKEIVPAFMAEIVESVKTYMIFEDSKEVKLVYIYDAINNYLRQIELSKKKEIILSPQSQFSNSFVNLIEHTLRQSTTLGDMEDSIVERLN